MVARRLIRKERRRERLDALSAAILMRTLIARPPGSRDYALDGTGIDAPERGVRRAQAVVELEDHEEDSHPLPPDAHDESVPNGPAPSPGKGNKGPTDAQWGKKSGDNGGRVTYWGYDVEALVRVPRLGRTGPNTRRALTRGTSRRAPRVNRHRRPLPPNARLPARPPHRDR